MAGKTSVQHLLEVQGERRHTMSNTPSLLPCPFCGRKATASVNKGESLWSHDVVDWTRVHCTNDDCNAQTEATCEGYEPSAVEVWNLRTPQPVVREPLTTLTIAPVRRFLADRGIYLSDETTKELIVVAHGITQKGGQHVE